MRWTCLCVLSVVSALDVVVDEKTGNYEITHEGQTYFRSGEVFFRSEGKKHSTADGSLTLASVFHTEDGLDGLGSFNETCLVYNASTGTQFQGNVRVYATAIFLEQFFMW